MILVDVHAHLDFTEYDATRVDVLKASQSVGVKAVVNNGVDVATNRKTLELSKKYPLIKPAFGFYPVHVAEVGLEKVKEELKWIEQNNPFALGEIGLDYKVGDDNPHGDVHKDVQIEAFRLFINLGKKLDVPLIIHSRKAESDVLDILEEEKAKKVVLHCFMGKKKLVERARDLGYSFSVPVVVTRLEQTQWLVKNVPISQLLTETDAPYMGPVRGVANSPQHVLLAVEKIAELQGLSVEDTANHLFMNYQRLFL